MNPTKQLIQSVSYLAYFEESAYELLFIQNNNCRCHPLNRLQQQAK